MSKFEENLVKVDEIYADVKALMAKKNNTELLGQMHEIVSYIEKSSFELKRIFNA